MADMKFSLILKADGAGNVTGQLKQVESAVKGVDGGAKSLSKSQNDLKRSTDQATASMKQQAVSLTSLKTLFASLGIAAFITQIGRATDSIASFERGIKAVSPSLGDATKSMEFVSRLANQMGLTLKSVRESFLDLASATQGTTLAGDETRRIFEAITKAGILMGKSAERIKLAFLGVSQMASLNVVSMEEVKQITENLGISLSRVAKAAGFDTVQAFRKAGEQGQVLATKVLPALADNLNEMAGGTLKVVNVFEASFNRLRTQWENLLNAIGASGLVDAMASAFAGLASAITAATEPVANFTKALFSLKNEVGTAVAALGTMLIVSKLVAGFTALQVAIAGAGGVTAAFASLNAVAVVAFGPAGWIALGVGLLAGLVIQMQALKGKTVELVGALDQAGRMSAVSKNVMESQGKILALQKELAALERKSGTGWGPPLEDLNRKQQILKDIAAEQEKIVKWSVSGGRWAADLAEGERKAAEEAAKLKAEQERLAGELGKTGKAAKDTRSELEKLNVPYADLIEKYSELYGVTPKVTAAVMKAESEFKAMAKSGKDAMGLMQVIPGTFADMLGKAATNIYDVNQNIQAGTKYLAIQIKTFGDLPKALAAYNAGPGRVAEAIKVGAREGITWWEAFLKLFPKAAKETGPYIEKVIANLRAYGEGKEEVEAVSDAFKHQQEVMQQTALAMAELADRQAEYLEGLWSGMADAQMELLRIQDPAGYTQALRDQERQTLETTAAKLAMSESDRAAAQAMLEGKFAAQDQADAYLESQRAIEEATRMREGWANSILQGFDQLWSNMISGAENAMDALKKTLKSWLYAIGQWLLKQAIIIPITAKLFGVDQKALGGGLLGAIAGNQGDAGKVVGLLTDLRGESQKTAENTADTVQGLGGVANTFGGLISGLAGGLWQFLAAILTALTTGNLAKAGESMTKAGSSIMDGMSVLKNLFGGTGIANALNRLPGASQYAYSQALAANPTTIFSGSNWGYGAAGAAGYFGGSYLFNNRGYSGMGGSLGGMAGYGLTAAGSALSATAIGAALGSWFPVIGTAIGAALGSWIGSMFGNEKVTGGVGYYDFKKRRSGAAHGDTDPAVVDMMTQLGQVMEGLDKSLRAIKGFENMKNFGAGMWLDTDSAGRVDAFYNSYSRGLKKASFRAAEDAAKWFVEQMMRDVKKQFEFHAADLGGLGDAITHIFGGMDIEQLQQELGALAQWLPEIIKSFSNLSQSLQNEVSDISKYHAKSVDDLVAILQMADDVNRGYAESLWDLYKAVIDIQKEGESLTAAYARSVAQFKELQWALIMTGKGVAIMNATTLKWADSLAELAGGLEQLASLQSYYYENYYNDAERLAAQQQAASQQVASFNRQLGLSGDAYIDTKAELKAYIESLDLTTEAGQKAYIEALKVAYAIDVLSQSLEDAAEEINSIMRGVLETVMELTGHSWLAKLTQLRVYWENLYQSAYDAGASSEQLAFIWFAYGIALDDLRKQIAKTIQDIYQGAYQVVRDNPYLNSIDEIRKRYDELEKELQDAAMSGGYSAEQYLAWLTMLNKAEQAEIEKIMEQIRNSIQDIYWSAYQVVRDNQYLDAIDNIREKYKELDKQLNEAAEAAGASASTLEEWTIMLRRAEQAEIAQVIEEALNYIISSAYDIRKAMLEIGYAFVDFRDAMLSDSVDEIAKARARYNEMAALAAQALAAYSGLDTETKISLYEDVLSALEGWANAIKELEQAWKGFADTLKETIQSLRYSAASPIGATGQIARTEREMARVQDEYQRATDSTKRLKLAEELSSLYQRRLSLAGDVYDRTSTEYMRIYNETMQTLNKLQDKAISEAEKQTEILKKLVDLYEFYSTRLNDLMEKQHDLMEKQQDAIKSQLDELIAANILGQKQLAAANRIIALLGGTESYQQGTAYVPQTGFYRLHQGEQVVPNGGRTEGEQKIILNLTVNGGDAAQVEAAVYRALKRAGPELKRLVRRN